MLMAKVLMRSQDFGPRILVAYGDFLELHGKAVEK